MPRNPKTRRSLAVPTSSPEPYPDLPFPTTEQCRSVRDDLLAFHGFPKEFERYRRRAPIADEPPLYSGESVVDGLVSVLLSQNTTEANSARAFASLKSAFPTWEKVLDAETRSVENAIRCGGLAATKAARIKSIMRGVKERRGEICLEYLRGLSVADVKAELSMFKGIGPKTVACVLMFHLQQDDFPVDTHVFRITKSIGWVPMKADREKAYLHLNNRIPNELKFDLNCLLVSHGKICHRCAIPWLAWGYFGRRFYIHRKGGGDYLFGFESMKDMERPVKGRWHVVSWIYEQDSSESKLFEYERTSSSVFGTV